MTEGKTVDIELNYEEKGTGEPFIFLHGNGENGSYFKKQTEYFQNQYRVISLDTRGHGASPRGDAPFTIEQFSCDLYDFMEAHSIARAIILGFSDGANIAMKFAIKHPDRIRALILNGGNLNTKGIKPTTQIPIEIGYRIAKHFAAKSPEAKRNAEMLGLMVNEPNIGPDELSNITAPTLVICGTKDVVKESHTKEIAAGIPNARMTVLKGNHFVADKNPAAFNRAVEMFLRECKV